MFEPDKVNQEKCLSYLNKLNTLHWIINLLSAIITLQLLIPEETPLGDDVDFQRLARIEMSGGNIKSSIFRAASRAALRSGDDRKVMMKDLEESADEEVGKTSTRTGFRRQDSDAARMYN